MPVFRSLEDAERIGEHRCTPPRHLIRRGSGQVMKPGMQWRCQECGLLHTMTREGLFVPVRR